MFFCKFEDPAEIIGGTGPTGGGPRHRFFICSICEGEILSSDPSAYHANCGLGAFHQKCLSDWIKNHPRCPDCSEPFLLSYIDKAASVSSSSDSQSSSDIDRIWDAPDPFGDKTEPEPEPEPEPESGTLKLPCTFLPAEGLMALINSGQASIQSLSGKEAWDLSLTSSDKKKALSLSPALEKFTRVFYHAPGEPRDESTLFLAHPEIKPDEPSSGHRHRHHRDKKLSSASPYDAVSASDRAEIDQLNDMVHSLRSRAETAGQFIRPPTFCGYLTIDGRRAKIVTGIIWLKPGEEAGERPSKGGQGGRRR